MVSSLSAKLSPRYYGPLEVEAKVGQVAHRLRLSLKATIHPVLHESQLWNAIGTVQPVGQLPTQLAANGQFIVEPEATLQVCSPSSGSVLGPEVLIKWKDSPEFEATWDLFDNTRMQFPEFHLRKR